MRKRFIVEDVFKDDKDTPDDILRYIVIDTSQGKLPFAAFIQRGHADWFARSMNNFTDWGVKRPRAKT